MEIGLIDAHCSAHRRMVTTKTGDGHHNKCTTVYFTGLVHNKRKVLTQLITNLSLRRPAVALPTRYSTSQWLSKRFYLDYTTRLMVPMTSMRLELLSGRTFDGVTSNNSAWRILSGSQFIFGTIIHMCIALVYTGVCHAQIGNRFCVLHATSGS